MAAPTNIPQSPCLSIHDFFQRPYCVPDFQRGYAWKEEQVTQLLEDIRFFFETGKPVYLLGQVIVSYGPDSDDYTLVDGQQRVTTLLLLLIVLHKRFMRIPNIHLNQGLNFTAGKLMSLFVRESGVSSSPLRATVLVAHEGIAIVEAYIHGKEQPQIVGWTAENIHNAYATIEEYFDEHWSDVTHIPELYSQIVNRIFLVRLELNDVEMAVDTFEKINNRGLGLNSADLIKNVIFQLVNDDDFVAKVSSDWDLANATLYLCKTGRIRQIEYLLRSMLFAKRGENVSSRGIRDAWRHELNTAKEAIDFAKKLPINATYLQNIDLGKTPRGEDTRANQGARYFGSVQNYPILLAAAHLNKEGYEVLSNLVDDRTVISLLAKERPQEFESVVPTWCKRVRDLSANATKEEIQQACVEAYIDIDRLLATIRVNLIGLRTKRSSDKKRIRYILARISRKVQIDASVAAVPDLNTMLHASAKTKNQPKMGYDIEHVNPLSTHRDNPLTDTIGNLVLAHPVDQRDASDDEPSLKMGVYRTSNLVLTQSLCAIDQLLISPKQEQIIRKLQETAQPYAGKWDDHAIENRALLYFNLLVDDFIISKL